MLKSSALALVLLMSASAYAGTNYSPQNSLIGASDAVQKSANYGAGVTIGVIDSGGTASWVGFQGWKGSKTQGRITSSTCIAGCSASSLASGNTDDNGHGTFVTSEIIGGLPAYGLVGIAPAASAMEFKVLNAQGSGNSAAVATGIKLAADRGANILNLSLGPSGTAAQQAAFYQSLASAINYAASKNVIIVFAGGNANQAFSGGANISGFSDAALQRMLFVGSTGTSLQKSSFSNTPGKAGFTSSSGKFYAYQSLWVMADGENIWGASNRKDPKYGYSYITQMSGTSMAAPQAAAVAALLASRWNFLIAKGTIAAIIEQSAQDLGTKGIDTTYGNGFLRADLALQPIGTLTVPIAGKKMPIRASQIISGSAFGNMSGVSSAFSKLVAYDNFSRDFSITTSSSIANKNANASVSPATLQVSGQSGFAARQFSDRGNGNYLTSYFGNIQSSTTTPGFASYAIDPNHAGSNEWSVGFSQNGTYVGSGQGSGSALSFNDARWGSSENNAFFNTDANASGALLKTTSGVNFTSVGKDINPKARFAVTMFTGSSNSLASQFSNTSEKGAAVAYTFTPLENWKLSLTGSFLKENNMLLGSISSGAFGLANNSSSKSLGIGSNIGLGDGYNLGLDAAFTTTDPSNNSASLVTGTSQIRGAAFSAALSQNNLSGVNDKLSLFIDKPLRIYSGSASLAVPTGVDANGSPVISNVKASLVPSGNETDIGFNYNRPLGDSVNAGLSVTYRNDADNISGNKDAAALLKVKVGF